MLDVPSEFQYFPLGVQIDLTSDKSVNMIFCPIADKSVYFSINRHSYWSSVKGRNQIVLIEYVKAKAFCLVIIFSLVAQPLQYASVY